MKVVNQHGRPWEHLDYIIQNQKAPCDGSFAVTTEDGQPLYGRCVPDTIMQTFYIEGWK